MKYITVRNLPPAVADALEKEKRRRGKSLNQTTVELLAEALGIGPQGRRSNGLAALAGGWTTAEWRAFEDSIALTEQVDEEMWR